MSPVFPAVVAETESYMAVHKPGGLHSAPLAAGETDTLLAWAAGLCPQVLAVGGRKAVEGGLLHRLDRETSGLVLLAKTQAFYDFLLDAQERGLFLKEYRALCVPAPDRPDLSPPCAVESGFRPYGPGRRLVKPVERGLEPKGAEVAWDRGAPYRTELLSLRVVDARLAEVRARLCRGFRHQVRVHLSWKGLPIRGDGLYGGGEGALALTAAAMEFPDPAGGPSVRLELPPQFMEGAGPASK